MSGRLSEMRLDELHEGPFHELADRSGVLVQSNGNYVNITFFRADETLRTKIQLIEDIVNCPKRELVCDQLHEVPRPRASSSTRYCGASSRAACGSTGSTVARATTASRASTTTRGH